MLRRLRISCELTKRDAVYYATRAEGIDHLRREFELSTRAGFDAEWIAPGALRRLTGIPAN